MSEQLTPTAALTPVLVPEAGVDNRTHESYTTPLQALVDSSAWVAGMVSALESAFESSYLRADVQTFTQNGTWNRPAGDVVAALLIVVGAGGGGATGENSVSSTAAGGQGGHSGVAIERLLPGSVLPASASVTVGVGGDGGVSTTTQSGLDGSAGTESLFGDGELVIRAAGGAGGIKGGSNGSLLQNVSGPAPETLRLQGQGASGNFQGNFIVFGSGTLAHGEQGFDYTSGGLTIGGGGGGAGGHIPGGNATAGDNSSSGAWGGEPGVGYGAGGGGSAGNATSEGPAVGAGGRGSDGFVAVVTLYRET